MRMKTIALLAVLGAAVPLSAASAMTIAKQQTVAASPNSTAVQKADYKTRKFRHKRQRYTPGGRYNKAPSHWHRYNSRPGNWRTRGCIIVGPIWWCP